MTCLALGVWPRVNQLQLLSICSSLPVSPLRAAGAGWATRLQSPVMFSREGRGDGDAVARRGRCRGPALWLSWQLGCRGAPRHCYRSWELPAIINGFCCTRSNVPEQLRGNQTHSQGPDGPGMLTGRGFRFNLLPDTWILARTYCKK